MREIFSGQIIRRQKITEALELTAKGESTWEQETKGNSLTDTPTQSKDTQKCNGKTMAWRPWCVEEAAGGESVRKKSADKNFSVANKYGTWE